MLLRVLAVSSLACCALQLAAQTSPDAAGLAAAAQKELPYLSDTYKYFHENPELSGHELQTATYMAAKLRRWATR